MQLYACFFSGSSDHVRQHELAHALLRFCLRQEYGITDYELTCGRLGKPMLSAHPELHFNLSHCNGLAVCGLGSAPLGVDAEALRTLRPGVIRRVCAEPEVQQLQTAPHPELTFTRLWTLKEAFVKAVGRGISYPMRQVAFDLSGDGIATNVTGAAFWQYVLAERFVLSVCAAAPEQTCCLHLCTPQTLSLPL